MYVVSSAYAACDPASLSRYTLFITSPPPGSPRSAVPSGKHLLLPAASSSPLRVPPDIREALLQLILG